MFWFDMNQHSLSLLDHSDPLKQNEVTTEDELFSRKWQFFQEVQGAI